VPPTDALSVSDGDPNVTLNESYADGDYQILETGTTKGKATLLGPRGFTYCVKMNRAGVTYWRCSVQNAESTIGHLSTTELSPSCHSVVLKLIANWQTE